MTLTPEEIFQYNLKHRLEHPYANENQLWGDDAVQDQGEEYGSRPAAPVAQEQSQASKEVDNLIDDLPSVGQPFTSLIKVGRDIVNNNVDALTSYQTLGNLTADKIKQTNAYKNYMYSDEEKLREKKNISIETGIPEGAISDTNINDARRVYNESRKLKALMPAGENEFDIERLYQSFPALNGLESESDIAIALNNIQNVRETHGIVETAKTGLKMGGLMRDYSGLFHDYIYGRTDKIDNNIWQKASDLQKEMQNMKSIPDFGDDPLLSIIGNTAEQSYRYGPSVAKGIGTGIAGAYTGAMVGAGSGAIGGPGGVAGGALAGAAYGFKGGFALGTGADMFDEIVGARFAEYAQMKNTKGQSLMTPEDARTFAIASAGIETGIEFWNYGAIMSVLGGKHAAAIKNIVAQAAGKDAIRSGIKRYLGGVIAGSSEIIASETGEEAVQDVNEKLWHNAILSYRPDNNYKAYTAQDMTEGAVSAAVEALPSVIGFSGMAGAGSTFSGVRKFAEYTRLKNEYGESILRLSNGLNMLDNLEENLKVNDLAKKSPDIYKNIIANEVKGTAYENVYIDTELALNDADVAAVYNQAAINSGYSQDEINAMAENKAPLAVPTAVYAQTILNNPAAKKMRDMISFAADDPNITRKAEAKRILDNELSTAFEKDKEKDKAIFEGFLDNFFPEASTPAERDTAYNLMMNYPDSPADGWAKERSFIQNAIDTKLEDVYKVMKTKSLNKNVIRIGGENPSVKENNKPQWYNDFMNANGREPNKLEIEKIASDIYSGHGEQYGYPQYEAYTGEQEEGAEKNKRDIESLVEQRSILNSIQGPMNKLTATEIGAQRGLSKEGVQVYYKLSKLGDTAKSDKARQAAPAAAMIAARMADRLAEIARESGNQEATALYYWDKTRFEMAANSSQDNNSGTQYQKSIGNIKTNITKTPAFKKWFGDSKAVDESGNPLIVYHTGSMGDSYDITKSRSYNGTPDYELPGIYLTTDKKESAEYGTPDQTKELYVSIQNPYDGDLYKLHKELKTWRKVMDTLIEQGYDGIINDDGSNEIIAFSPSQIKSVDNFGNFDSNNANIYFQSAFHGSPHKFDKFTLDHIGSGEGAQAHGWGLYFSLDKGTAEKYRNKLSREFNDEEYSGKTLEGWIDYFANKSSILAERVDDDDSPEFIHEARLVGREYLLAIKLQQEQNFNNVLDFAKQMADREYEKEAADWFEKTFSGFKALGQVYEVDIPNNEVMLLEDKDYTEQSETVKKALDKIFAEHLAEHFEGVPENMTGGRLYKNIVFELQYKGSNRPKEDASKLLNSYGIQGIRYNGTTDGECAVVFDDEAIKVLNTFYQNNGVNHGSTTFLQSGERIVKLFESADQSTLVHELAHVYLNDFVQLARMENAPGWVQKDFETIKKLLQYDGVSDLNTEQHEKFARQFEAYLMSGEAPTKSLKAVFRKFKNWLTKIYQDFLNLGGQPSTEVRAVMDRMLASESEIERESKLADLNTLAKNKNFTFADETTSQMYARWQQEAKDEAEEKVLAEALKDVKEESKQTSAEAIRERREQIKQELLASNEVFRAAEYVKKAGLDVLPTLGYTEERYKKELKEAGGSLGQAVETKLKEKATEKATMNAGEIARKAQELLATSEYQKRVLALELKALERKKAAEEKFDKKIIDELDAIDSGITARLEEKDPQKKAASDQEINKKIADLQFKVRWTAPEAKLLKDRKIKALKKIIEKGKKGLRVLRDEAVGTAKEYDQMAERQLSRLQLSEARASKMWLAKAKRAAQKTHESLAAGKWDEALAAKREHLMYTAMTAASIKMKREVDKKIQAALKRSSSISRGTVQMPANERYMYQHALYVFGLSKKDAIQPIESESLISMLNRYGDEYEGNFADENGKVDLPAWLISALAGREVFGQDDSKAKGFEALKIDDFTGVMDLLSTIYTIGKDANKAKVIKDENGNPINISDAEMLLEKSIEANVNIPPEDKPNLTNPTYMQKVAEYAKKRINNLIKAETIFDQIDGGKHGYAMKYFYDPINEARNKEMDMLEDAAKNFGKAFALYSRSERQAMFSERKYTFGISTLTQEQAICIALNWGTVINQKRIRDGYKVNGYEVEELLTNLTQKDWTFVESIWQQMSRYWSETAALEERMTGVGIEKQDAIPFTVMGKDGNIYQVSGGYYPIVYDKNKATKAIQNANDDIAKSGMSGNAVLGTKHGFTKSRVQGKVEMPVLLGFDVFANAMGDVIHNLCFREVVRDTNKLMNNRNLTGILERAYTPDIVESLKNWVRDNWAEEVKPGKYDGMVNWARRHTTMAIMGYRTTTALLNVLNLSPMMDYLGAANAAGAVRDFYNSPKDNWNFVLSKSIFLRNRASTMDRDVRETLKGIKDTGHPAWQFVQRESFTIIAATDQMLAMPLWLTEYKRTFREGIAKGLNPEAVEREAINEGDKAVRRVFGSGEVKDLAPVQKGSEMDKALTMFYSYFNTVFNALARDKNTGNRAQLIRGIMYWLVITGIGDAFMRSALGGGSDDDKDGYLLKAIKRVPRSITEQATGMLPVTRVLAQYITNKLYGQKGSSGVKATAAFEVLTRFQKAFDTAFEMLGENEANKDWIDLLQDFTKLGNSVTGVADTFTDGIWTSIRYASNDFDNAVADYLKAVVFDRKLKKKENKK